MSPLRNGNKQLALPGMWVSGAPDDYDAKEKIAGTENDRLEGKP